MIVGRTHCSKGHEYATTGFYFSQRDGARVCRVCQKEAKREQRARSNNPQKEKTK